MLFVWFDGIIWMKNNRYFYRGILKLLYDSLYDCIFNDIYSVVDYLHIGVRVGFIYVILISIVSYSIYFKQRIKEQYERTMSMHAYIWHFIGSTLFIIYFFVLCNIVYFSREPGSRIDVDMRLFSTWGTTSQEHAYVIENVLLFMPFGFLFPACLPKRMSVLTIFVGALCSICIEYIQYRTGRGYCQIDDVVTNTFGTVIGYIIFIICNSFFQKMCKLYRNKNVKKA